MIGYTTVGSNDIDRATVFYNALFQLIGAKFVHDTERFKAWSVARNQPFFGLVKPYDGEAATVGNGMMIGMLAKDKAQVDALYALAIELGAKDEGQPGMRSKGYYVAYFRDLDGNKLNFHCHVGE